jgi:hypothetical protein
VEILASAMFGKEIYRNYKKIYLREKDRSHGTTLRRKKRGKSKNLSFDLIYLFRIKLSS